LPRALARGCRDRPENRAIYFRRCPSMAETGAWNIAHRRQALLSRYFAFIYFHGGQNVTGIYMHYAQSWLGDVNWAPGTYRVRLCINKRQAFGTALPL